MPANAMRVYSAADAVKAADVVREDERRREKWPYLNVYPPPNSEPVHAINTAQVLVPAPAVQVTVLTYPVPSGYRFFLQGVVQDYIGGAFLPGDILWTIDRNTPLGIVNIQGQPEQGLITVPVRLGSFTFGTQWWFPRAYEFEELDIVRSKATNVAAVAGAGNFLVSAFLGYIVPIAGR